MTAAPRIVVLGAGYSGVAAAKLLATRTAADVTVVNNRDRFVERMRNHQLATGHEPRHTTLKELFDGTGARLVVDQVTGIDLGERRVELASGAEPIGYDILVYALGSHADLGAAPGAAEHAYAVAVAEDAARLHDRMRTASSVTVVGAGPTGLETATALAETYPDRTVRLVTGGALGGTLSDHARDYVSGAVDRLGIKVSEHATVAKVDANGLLLDGGDRIDTDAVAWTAGFAAPPLAGEAGLAVDQRGRMLVDGTLRSLSHPEVHGIGDAAAAHTEDGQVLRMGCGPGGLAAACAFHAIDARLAGRTSKPLRAYWDALCISLGENDAVLQRVDFAGNPRGKVYTGRSVAMLKKAVLKGTGWYNLRYPTIVVVGARQG